MLIWICVEQLNQQWVSVSLQTHSYRQSWNGPLFHLFVAENSWVHGDGMRAPCTCLNPSAPCICLELSKMPGLGCIERSSKKASNLMVIETNLSVNLIRIFFSFWSRAYLVWTQLWIEIVFNIKSELYEANKDHGFNQTGWTRILRRRVSLCGWFVFTSPVNMGGDNSLINHHYILEHSSFASPVLEGIIDEQREPKKANIWRTVFTWESLALKTLIHKHRKGLSNLWLSFTKFFQQFLDMKWRLRITITNGKLSNAKSLKQKFTPC